MTLSEDLETLAHELEQDCNYFFAGLRDGSGDLYSAKLDRLRHAIQDMDRVLEEYRVLARLVQECSRAEGPLSEELRTRLRESPALLYGVLEECGCCGDLVRVSEVTLNGAQALCPNCK